MDFLFRRLGGNPCCNNANSELYYAHLNCQYNSMGVWTPNIGSNTQLLFTSAMLNSMSRKVISEIVQFGGHIRSRHFYQKKFVKWGFV
jgi:hypothetical protein